MFIDKYVSLNIMEIYTPYKSDKPNKKYFISTPSGKKVYFGAAGYEHFTDGHLDEKRRKLYENRHKKRKIGMTSMPADF